MTETDSAGVIEEVQNHTIDIGFTGSILDKRSCSYLSFYEDELLIVTPNLPRFRKMEKEKMAQRPDWILQEAIIMREYGSGTRRETEKRLRRLGIDLSGMNVVANMSSPEAIIRSVKSGIGITFISRLAAQEAIQAGESGEATDSSGEKNVYAAEWHPTYRRCRSTGFFCRCRRVQPCRNFRFGRGNILF